MFQGQIIFICLLEQRTLLGSAVKQIKSILRCPTALLSRITYNSEISLIGTHFLLQQTQMLEIGNRKPPLTQIRNLDNIHILRNVYDKLTLLGSS